MAKYSVKMGEVAMYSNDDPAKVQDFYNKLSEAMKPKCKLHGFDLEEAAKEEVKTEVKAEAVVETKKTATGSEEVYDSKPETTQRQTAQSAAPATQKENNMSTQQAAPAQSLYGSFSSHIGGKKGSDVWKAKDGLNLIRILPKGGANPQFPGVDFPFMLWGFHSSVGEDLMDTVVCPRITKGESCPICRFVSSLYNSKDKADEDIAKKLKGYKSIEANIIDLTNVEKGVQPFAFGIKLADLIMTRLNDPDYVNVLDPVHGSNFKLFKHIENNFPTYTKSEFARDVVPLSKIMPDWADHIIDLTHRNDNKVRTHDQLNEILDATKRALLDGKVPQDYNDRSKPQVAATHSRQVNASAATHGDAGSEFVDGEQVGVSLDNC